MCTISSIIFLCRLGFVLLCSFFWFLVPVAFAMQTQFFMTIVEDDASVEQTDTVPQQPVQRRSRRSGVSGRILEFTENPVTTQRDPVRQDAVQAIIQTVQSPQDEVRSPVEPPGRPEAVSDSAVQGLIDTQQVELESLEEAVRAGTAAFDSFQVTIDTRDASAETYDAFGADVNAPLVISVTVSLISVGASAIGTKISLFG